MDKFSSKDIEFLKAVAQIIGEAVERMPFIEEDLSGARLYAARTTEENLNAAHTALKMFIQDRT